MYFLYQMRTYLETLNLLKEHWTAKKIVGDSVCLWFDVNFSTLLRYLSDTSQIRSLSQANHSMLIPDCFGTETLIKKLVNLAVSPRSFRQWSPQIWSNHVAWVCYPLDVFGCNHQMPVQTERCRWSHVNLKFASEKKRANNNVLINQVWEGRVLCRPEGCHSSDWKSPLYRTNGTDILEKCGRNDSPPRLASNLLLFSRDSVSQTSAADLPLKRHPVGDLQPKDRCTLGASNEWGSKLCLFSHHDVWSFLVWSMSDIIWSTCYQWIFRLKFATRLVSFFPSLQLWTVSLVVPLFGQSGLNWKQGSYSQWTFLFWTELDNWHPERKIAVVKWGQFLHSEFAAGDSSLFVCDLLLFKDTEVFYTEYERITPYIISISEPIQHVTCSF